VPPSGEIAIAAGPLPAAIGAPAVFVSIAIGVTLFEKAFETYAVAPSGVIATARGTLPTGIGGPAVFVAVAIGVTLSEIRFAT